MTQEELIAFCGIDCLECPAYIAKRTDDVELREKTAQEWSGSEGPIKPEEINCDGCILLDQELYRFCNDCQVRICGFEKGLQNCAHCNEYSCEKLERLWDMFKMTETKKTLDNIRSNLV
ncbi:MAG: DUF3795 domain-containing protein [Asgard group archaeon]|nr:DUF3795 domain-containing protein [Asgard group archaeon]